MPTYITLAKWTEQGIRNVKETPKRIEAFETAVKGAGGTLKELYMVMGEYHPILALSGFVLRRRLLVPVADGRLASRSLRPSAWRPRLRVHAA
jgi:hypothetical protein